MSRTYRRKGEVVVATKETLGYAKHREAHYYPYVWWSQAVFDEQWYLGREVKAHRDGFIWDWKPERQFINDKTRPAERMLCHRLMKDPEACDRIPTRKQVIDEWYYY